MFAIHEMEYFFFVTVKLHKHVEKAIPEKKHLAQNGLNFPKTKTIVIRFLYLKIRCFSGDRKGQS